jgi:predicted Zn-dependent protease
MRDLVLGHPDTLCRLSALTIRHDRELGAEQIIQEGRLPR